MHHRAPVSAMSVVCLAAISGGCHSFHDARFNDGNGASGESVLLVPFRESRRDRWYGESREGRGVVKFLRDWTEEQAVDAVFVESELAEEVLHQVLNWTKKDLRVADWVRIARPCGARYVIEGDILALELDNALSIGFYDPVATVRYRVIDLESGREVWSRDSWEIKLDERESQFQPTYEFENADKVRALFLAHIGSRLGEELYGYHE